MKTYNLIVLLIVLLALALVLSGCASQPVKPVRPVGASTAQEDKDREVQYWHARFEKAWAAYKE